MKLIESADVKDKVVFLRVDFNVPVKDGAITDLNRVRAAIPTIQLLVDKGAKILIGSHLGRPDGKRSPGTSLRPVAEKLASLLKREVGVTDHILGEEVVRKVAEMKPGDILILGNLRWHSEEEENDKEFAKKLAEYADIYVNDAFAVSHRANASVEAITHYLPSYAGLLLESEITTLQLLLLRPEEPFVLVTGGAKVKDKAPVIEKLADKATSILIGGAIGNTFLLAKGQNVSESVVDTESIDLCKQMLGKYEHKIVLPIDGINEPTEKGGFKIMDIGPATQDRFAHEIKKAKTIFWNGNLGYTEDERYRAGTNAIAVAIANTDATKVVAGGDTVGAVDELNLREGFSFISTGGGAALEFLAEKELPGIKALG